MGEAQAQGKPRGYRSPDEVSDSVWRVQEYFLEEMSKLRPKG